MPEIEVTGPWTKLTASLTRKGNLTSSSEPEAAPSNRTPTPSVWYGLLNRDEYLAAVEIGIQSLILCVAFSSNCLVFVVLRFSCRCHKLSRMNMMIGHLAAADLFVVFFNVLPQLIWDVTGLFHGNDFLCRGVAYFQLVAMFASSYVLVATAVDRYNAICRPLLSHTWSAARSRTLVLVAWAVALVFASPQTVVFAYREVGMNSGLFSCLAFFDPPWTLTLYVSWTATAIYFLPSIILFLAYVQISRAVWRSVCCQERASVVSMTTFTTTRTGSSKRESSRYLGSASSRRESPDPRERGRKRGRRVLSLPLQKLETVVAPRSNVKVISKAKMRTIKLSISVNLSYVICWGPFFISHVWAAYDPKAPYEGNRLNLYTEYSQEIA